MRWHSSFNVGTGNTVAADNAASRYRRHLVAIFKGPCRCWRWTCPRCVALLVRWRFRDICRSHEATCQACIAEHALYVMGDHPAVEAGTP